MTQGFHAKDYIAAISPYVAGKPIEETAREYGIDPKTIVKLASNENPLGMPASAREAVAVALLHPELYPDGNARAFREAVARFNGLTMDWVMAGNGSDEILELIARVLLEPGTNCVFSQYSFSVYALSTQENGAECIEVPAKGFQVDLDAMLAAINAKTRLVFITNPNNPTGLALPAAAIENFVARVPADCVVVLDEAYRDYLAPEERIDAVALLKRFPNLVVTRTFSKAYGMAGLRAGYGLAHPDFVEMINRIRPPFNMNIAAQAAAAGAIDDQAFLARVYATNREGVATLEAFFTDLGLEFVPTRANFILVKAGDCAKAVYQGLLRRGVIVRPVTSYGLPAWLRITVGTPEQNARFMDAFRAALAELG